jgi:hypothetical protein
VIVVRLQGGLGNQLFQYAAGRALADRLGRGLSLDLRDFGAYERRARLARIPLAGGLLAKGDTPRPFLLDRFEIRAARWRALALWMAGFPSHRRTRRLLRLFGLGRGILIQERDRSRLASLDACAASGDPAYLDGYWQSWRYFEGSEAALREDLSFKRPPSGRNALLLRRLQRGRSVCVHVRRGDYVSDPGAARVHGLMGRDYYDAAVKRLGPSVRGASYYVFSDEPAWARAHLRFPGPTRVVDHNGVDEPEEDLRLMSACRHFIMANSSLSWWGAWLSTRPGKRVVAPQRWFKSGAAAPDLLPPNWISL